jgi:hypothetical protein
MPSEVTAMPCTIIHVQVIKRGRAGRAARLARRLRLVVLRLLPGT